MPRTHKTRDSHHAAALRAIERMDSDITPEEIAVEAAQIKAENMERLRLSNGAMSSGPGGIRDVILSTLPGNISSIVRGK